jgi:hypothetical protein
MFNYLSGMDMNIAICVMFCFSEENLKEVLFTKKISHYTTLIYNLTEQVSMTKAATFLYVR